MPLTRLQTAALSEPSQVPRPGNDQPRYQWRGVLVDSARTVWQPTEIKELLIVMARYGFNRLHWHLTDDSGWRFAIPEYPKVTEISAMLPRFPFAWYANVDAAKREAMFSATSPSTGQGFYTDEEIADIVSFAASLGIEVLPEVDLPGHMGAIIRAYPELGDPALVDLPPEEWPHANDLLWPGEATDAFIRAALDRACELFPSEMIHIGGDECRYETWEADEALMAAQAELGRPDAKAIQGAFTHMAREYLQSKGRRIAAWDEVTHLPGLDGELIFGWQHAGGVEAAQKSGHPWVYADSFYFYLNKVAGDPQEEPVGMLEPITLSDTFNAPIPDDPNLVGIQAACWSEFVPDRKALHYQLFPRLLAVAELAWNGTNATTFEDFTARAAVEMEWLAQHGIHGRPM